MTMHLICGQMNSGKTLMASYFAFLNHLEGRIVYSNIPLAFPHRLINRDFIFYLGEKQPSLDNSCFLLDELWIWLDCRDSMSNKIATYFFLQSSKDDGQIYITSQSFSQNDKRIKENFHKLLFCERTIKVNDKYYKINSDKRFLPKEIQEVLYIEGQEFKKINSLQGDLMRTKKYYLKADIFFKLYNTKQKVRHSE